MGAEPVQEETIEEGAPSEGDQMLEEAPYQEEAPEELPMDEAL